MVIEHNIPAMNANRFLGINNAAVSSSLEKLASGLRINKAADDAAGLAISEKMRNQINGLEMAEQNAKNGISLIQTAEGALNETHSIISRMRELAVQSSNGTYDEGDRMMITQEFDELKSELNRIAESTHYNGIKLLDGSLSSTGVSASTGAGANTGTFISATKAEFVINASDAFGEEAKATYTYDLSGLVAPAVEGAEVLDNLGSLGGLAQGDTIFSLNGVEFKYDPGDSVTESATEAGFSDIATLQTALTNLNGVTAHAWTYSLSDDGILTAEAKVAGAVGGTVAGVPTEASSALEFGSVLKDDAGVTPASIAATEVIAGRDAGPLPVEAVDNGAKAPTVGTVTKNLDDDSGGAGVTAIKFEIGAWAGDSLNGKDISNFTFTDGSSATEKLSFVIDGKTYISEDLDMASAGADLSKAMTFTEDGGTNTIKVTFTGGASGQGNAEINGIITDLGSSPIATINNDGIAADPDAAPAAVQGQYNVGGNTYVYAATPAADKEFSTVEELADLLTADFGKEYEFTINEDDTITATALVAGSAKNGGATINLDDSDAAADVVKDSAAVKGSMGTDEFKANKSGANTISSALSDVLEFGNTGIVKGSGTEYRVSADKKDEFLATLDTGDKTDAGVLKALGLSTQEYTINQNGEDGDLVIQAKASGADPNEEKLLLHSQQDYRSMLYKEKDGTDDYRNLTISVDANKVGDTKFIGNTLTINGRTYQFTGQSDKNEAGDYAKAGDKLDNGNYAIDIGALADENDDAYAAGITSAIVDAVNVAEADAFDMEGIEFAVEGKGFGKEIPENATVATFSIRVNSAGITSNGNAGGLVFQIGANGSDDQRISLSVNAMDAKSLGETSMDVEFAAVTGMTVQDASIGTVEDANKAIDILDGATQMVSAQRANLGALQNRLESTLNSLGVSIENLSSAESIIRDTDMAKEMMEFTKNNIKVQAAQAMLAQANSLPQGVLQLLR